jgi:acetyl-CoA carboxylase carboxyl transferase subunit alpha
MPHHPNRHFLDFEQPVKDLYEQLASVKSLSIKNPYTDYNLIIKQVEKAIVTKRNELAAGLTPWQRVQLSRHPDRPYMMKYIEQITTNFVEQHGDRSAHDDNAMVGGFAKLEDETIMFIGQQKGIDTRNRRFRNFGMANPSGYRKALRLMLLAEKFNKPIITLIDTPGAYPGIEAEEQGCGEAIARNIFEMMRLKVPVICVIIGEGGSSGALGIGIGDRTLMMQNTWCSVVSPESCSTILWHNPDNREAAAEQLRLTATEMKDFGLIDGIIAEPAGGAHWNYEEAAGMLKTNLLSYLPEIKDLDTKDRTRLRIARLAKIGSWSETGLI